MFFLLFILLRKIVRKMREQIAALEVLMKEVAFLLGGGGRWAWKILKMDWGRVQDVLESV